MKLLLKQQVQVCLLLIIAIFNFSCSKDSDLLSDYVISTEEDVSGIFNLVVNDSYYVNMDNSVVFDVLSNDRFDDLNNVSILETSNPQFGDVVINNDNTLTYTPSEEESEVEDNFTYTVEQTQDDGSQNTQTGTVTINSSRNFTGVNLKTFGVVGDGVTDDTRSIQLALNSGNNLVADPGLTFLVSPNASLAYNTALSVFNGGDQTIDWNGGIMTTNNSGDDMRFLLIDKPSGKLLMDNLTIDGNGKADRGLFSETPVSLLNVDVRNLVGSSAHIAYGIGARVGFSKGKSNQGDSLFVGCDISNITSDKNDNKVGNASGAVRSLQFTWSSEPITPVTVTFKDAILTDVWGEDGDHIVVGQGKFSMKSNSSRVVFDNLYVTQWARRGVKGIADNITIQNCFFEATPMRGRDPNYPGSSNLGPAGIISFSNYVHLSSVLGNNQSIINTRIKGANAGFNDSWDVVTFNNAENGLVKNCTFENGAMLRFGVTSSGSSSGNHQVINTKFGNGGYINDVGFSSSSQVVGTLKIDKDNTYIESDWNKLDSYNLNNGSIIFVDF